MFKKLLSSILLIICALIAHTETARAQTFYGTTDLKEFRAGRDKEFRSKDESPLTEADFANFKGLQYFDTNKKYRVTANLTKTAAEKYFLMPTSSGSAKKYAKFGVLNFKLGGKSLSLNVYKPELPAGESYQEYRNLLFVPFQDATNGAETYKIGRYLFINAPSGTETILDFNLASNPSCAYGNSKFSCPIPPKDNRLPIKIEAGEKLYPIVQKTEIK